jgi:hypothetical protein
MLDGRAIRGGDNRPRAARAARLLPVRQPERNGCPTMTRQTAGMPDEDQRSRNPQARVVVSRDAIVERLAQFPTRKEMCRPCCSERQPGPASCGASPGCSGKPAAPLRIRERGAYMLAFRRGVTLRYEVARSPWLRLDLYELGVSALSTTGLHPRPCRGADCF